MIEKWPQQDPGNENKMSDIVKDNTNSSLNSSLESMNIAKILPCNTTEEILESVFDKKESFWEPIDSILNKKFTIEWFLKFQEEEDAVTNIIYKKEINENGKEMIAFPQKIKESNTPPYLWTADQRIGVIIMKTKAALIYHQVPTSIGDPNKVLNPR